MNENLQKLIGMLIAKNIGFEFVLNDDDADDFIYHEVDSPKGYILWEINIDHRTDELIFYTEDSTNRLDECGIDYILNAILELEAVYDLNNP